MIKAPTIKNIKYLLLLNNNFENHSKYNRVKLKVKNMSPEEIKNNIIKSLKEYPIKNYILIQDQELSSIYDSAKFDIYNKHYEITICDPERYDNAGLKFEQIFTQEINSILQSKINNHKYDYLFKKMNISIENVDCVEYVGNFRHIRGKDIDKSIINIGKETADVKFNMLDGKIKYISLKNAVNKSAGVNFLSGHKINFIKKINNEIKCDESEFSKDDSYLTRLLSILNIDIYDIANGFNNYYQKNGKTSCKRIYSKEYDLVKLNKKIKDHCENFISSVYGYGYFHVYNNSRKIYINNIKNRNDAIFAAGEISKIKLKFPTENRKYFEIGILSKNNIFNAEAEYKLNIRNAFGDFMPLNFESSKRIYFDA